MDFNIKTSYLYAIVILSMRQKKFLRKKSTLIGFAVIVLALASYAVFGMNSGVPTYTTSKAKQERLIESVLVNGNVKADRSVDLAFEKSGKISAIHTDVGNKVTAGMMLASLESSSERASVESAEARLASEQARLSELKKGARPEDIEVSQSNLEKARHDLQSAYDNTSAILLDVYTKADNALNRQTSVFFRDPNSSNPELSFISNNSEAKINSENGRTFARAELEKLKVSATKSTLVPQEIERNLSESQASLGILQSHLNTLSVVLSYAINLSDSTIATYKDNLNTARVNTTTALTNTINQSQSIETNKLMVQKSERELALKKAGGTPETILIQEGKVKEAEAQLLTAKASYQKDFIFSPLNGVTTKQDGNIGEIVGANSTIISLQSDAQFKIETNVPETDISKIKPQNPAKVTLDAYGSNETFDAKVISVNPAEEIIDGVPTYKVTLSFNSKDERVKAGMTANIKIETSKKEGVIGIPTRAVEQKDGKSFIRILDNTET